MDIQGHPSPLALLVINVIIQIPMSRTSSNISLPWGGNEDVWGMENEVNYARSSLITEPDRHSALYRLLPLSILTWDHLKWYPIHHTLVKDQVLQEVSLLSHLFFVLYAHV